MTGKKIKIIAYKILKITNTCLILLLSFFVTNITFTQIASAALYSPGETLEPDCPSTESLSTCGVVAPATSGSNSNITSLTGLTIPLSVPQGGSGLSSYSPGNILYALSSSSLTTLNIGATGKVLKVLGGLPVWGDDNGGTSYTASESGLHLDGGTNVFSLVLDGPTLANSGSGLKISDSYTGQSSITTLGTIGAGIWNGGAIGTSYGGTGISSAPSNGQLLIGNGTGYTLAGLSGADGVTVTNGAGAITLGLSISSAPTISSVNDNDYLPIYTSGDETRKKITYNDLFSGVLGALTYQGTWNPNTNSPAVSDADCNEVGEKGRYYVVNTIGTTTLGGVSEWYPGDWAVCNGTLWERTINTNDISSVFSRTGNITAQAGDYTGSLITNTPSGNIAALTTQAAINELDSEKESLISAGSNSQFWRGDKSWQVLDTSVVPENGSLYFTDARARTAYTNTATGLTYNNTSGVLSLTSGYEIPSTSSTTNWNTAFNRSVSSWTSPLQFISGVASITEADTSNSGYLSAADWTTFNNKVATSRTISTTAPLAGGGDLSSNRTLSISQSSSSTDGYLSFTDWSIFNNKQAALGFTPENVSNKSTLTTLGTSDTLYPSQNAVKTYIDNKSLGLVWQSPVELINVVGDTATPVGSPVHLDAYIINTGGATGIWSSFAEGDLVQYQTDRWVKIKSLAVGDYLGVAFKSATTPSGSLAGKKNYKFEVTGGTAGAFTYTFSAPENNDALFVQNVNAYYHNVSFTYSLSLLEWVQLSASVDNSFASGFKTTGAVISLGDLTSDWNQEGNYNISTAGDVNVNGGDLKTTSTTATLFNDNANILNIGGSATTIGLGAAGATLIGGGALSVKSATSSALTIDSGTTGALNLGTGNNAKTINLGTGAAGNIINIGTSNSVSDAISIGSVLDVFSLNSTGLNVTTSGALSGVSTINTVSHSSSSIVFAGAGSLQSTENGSLIIDSGTTGAVNIGTGDNSKTITIGNIVGSTALNLSAGAGGSLYTTTNSTFSLNTGTGQINLGTDAAAKTISIGNSTGATSLSLNSGTGGLDLGANAVAHSINIGTGASVIKNINIGGTGANIIRIGDTQSAGSLSIGAGMASGTISIGGTGLQTGAFDLAPGTGAQSLNISNSSGIKNINIGNGVSGNTISIGNGSNTSAQVVNIAGGAANANSSVNILSGVALSGTQTLNLGTGASAKIINIGNTTGATSLTLNSGTGPINIGTGSQARAVNIATGAALQTVTLGSTNGASTLTLESGTGALNIGTGAFAKTITLGNTTGATRLNLNSGTGGYFVSLAGLGTQTNGKIVVCFDSATGKLFKGSTATSCNSSSLQYKHDIENIKLGLDAIKALRPVSFVYNSDSEKSLGFIAEEAALVDERLVVRDNNGMIQAIDSDQFTPIITSAIQEMSALLGEISPKINIEGTDSNSLSFIASIQSENNINPIDIISQKIKDGKQFLSNFVVARVTAIRGYYDEIFSNKSHQKTLCIGESGNETCITKEELDNLLSARNITQVLHDDVVVPEKTTTGPVSENNPDTNVVLPVPDSNKNDEVIETPLIIEPIKADSLEAKTDEALPQVEDPIVTVSPEVAPDSNQPASLPVSE